MIYNLTQHDATIDQQEAGVVDVQDKTLLRDLLTVRVIEFDGLSGLARMSRCDAKDLLETRAARIIEEFVLPLEVARILEVSELARVRQTNHNKTFYRWWRESLALSFMVGGFPPLVTELAQQLKARGHNPLHALTDRVVKTTNNPDGTVSKQSEFKHVGFYPA